MDCFCNTRALDQTQKLHERRELPAAASRSRLDSLLGRKYVSVVEGQD
jgi:hypothetical protein